MSAKNVLYLFIISLMIVGCSKSVDSIQKQKVINELDNAPTWVKSPHLPLYISEVGKSNNIDSEFITQRDEAIEDAKANLSHKIQTKLITIFSLIGKKDLQEDGFAQKIEDAHNLLVSNAINESRVMKLWKSSKSNLYIMVCSDTQKIKNDLHNIINTSFKDHPSIASQYRLYLEQGKIDLALNN